MSEAIEERKCVCERERVGTGMMKCVRVSKTTVLLPLEPVPETASSINLKTLSCHFSRARY